MGCRPVRPRCACVHDARRGSRRAARPAGRFARLDQRSAHVPFAQPPSPRASLAHRSCAVGDPRPAAARPAATAYRWRSRTPSRVAWNRTSPAPRSATPATPVTIHVAGGEGALRSAVRWPAPPGGGTRLPRVVRRMRPSASTRVSSSRLIHGSQRSTHSSRAPPSASTRSQRRLVLAARAGRRRATCRPARRPRGPGSRRRPRRGRRPPTSAAEARDPQGDPRVPAAGERIAVLLQLRPLADEVLDVERRDVALVDVGVRDRVPAGRPPEAAVAVQLLGSHVLRQPVA